jgi:putative tricarboxylic transport membrane protein
VNRADTVIGAGLTIAFLAMALAALQLPYWAQFAPGAGFAPVWFALAGGAISAYVAFRGLGAPVPGRISRPGSVRVAIAVAALVVAMAVVPYTGFLIAVSAYLLVVTLGVERMRPIHALAAAGGTVALIYVLFAVVLRVPFPKGWLGF